MIAQRGEKRDAKRRVLLLPHLAPDGVRRAPHSPRIKVVTHRQAQLKRLAPVPLTDGLRYLPQPGLRSAVAEVANPHHAYLLARPNAAKVNALGGYRHERKQQRQNQPGSQHEASIANAARQRFA